MGVRRDKQRKNRWYYEFRMGDDRFRGYPKTPEGEYVRTKAEAIDAEVAARKKAKAEIGMAKSGIKPGAYLLAQAIDRHTGNLLDASESHLNSLRRIGSEMLRHFGVDRAVVDITVDDADAYRKFVVAQNRRIWIGGPRRMTPADFDNPKLWKELDRKRSPSEANHCLDLLRCALQAAHNIRDTRTGERCLPFPPEIVPVFDPERDPTPMPETEFRVRLAGAPSWVVEAANLAWYFGVRKTEALIVDLRHLDWENECLRLLGSETKSGKDQALYGGRRGWILGSRARRGGADRRGW